MSAIIEVIVKYNSNIDFLEKLGIIVEILNENYAILTLKTSQVPSLYNFREIEYIEFPKDFTFSLKKGTAASNISKFRALGYRGNGVIIGVIDSGIDYLHPDFISKDGKSRILFIWDQTIRGNVPEGFKDGSEYNNQQINEALKVENSYDIISEVDLLGHGTAVCGIAAGGGVLNKHLEGVAPDASLIVVKVGKNTNVATTTDIMRAIKYIMTKAEELNMPVVVNLSFGANDGSHDGLSILETYIDAMSKRWKSVFVVASGNEGAASHHYEGKLKKNEIHEIKFVVSENLSKLYLTLWKNFVDTMDFELILPNGNSLGYLNENNRVINKNIEGIRITAHYKEPTHYNKNQEIYFMFNGEDAYIPAGIWILKVSANDSIVDGKINAWLPTTAEVGIKTAFTNPTVTKTLTIPSTSASVITVGGYDCSNDTAAIFTGQGENNFLDCKPDLVAPAVNIISTAKNGNYESFSGTSLAAPFITGVVALLLEWGIVQKNDTFLYGQKIKAFLIKNTRKFAGTKYPNPVLGYGCLYMQTMMNDLIKYKRNKN